MIDELPATNRSLVWLRRYLLVLLIKRCTCYRLCRCLYD
jgi:hypothetical protein